MSEESTKLEVKINSPVISITNFFFYSSVVLSFSLRAANSFNQVLDSLTLLLTLKELGTLKGSTPLRQVLCFIHFIDLTGSADPGSTMEFLPRLSGTNPSIDFPGEKPKGVPIDKIDGFLYLKKGSLI